MKVLGFFSASLSRRNWIYLLSLLVPFVAYNLVLKAYDVLALQSGDPRFARTLDLMWSDVFFNLGYALLWIALFAAARRKPQHWTVVILFHISTMLVVMVTTGAHRYFRETGATLDYDIIALWLSRFDQREPLLTYGVPPSASMLLFAALLYTAFGPWLLTHAVGRWRGCPRASPAEAAAKISFSGPLVLFLLALGFVSLSLLVGSGSADTSTPLSKDRFANVLLTAVEEAITEEDPPATGSAAEDSATDTEEVTSEDNTPDVSSDIEYLPMDASLAQTPRTERRNVVLVHLESARARSVTPYNEDLDTMPFLNELAKSSLLAEDARVVVPRSSKGSTATNCGIEPALFPGPEFEPGGIPSPCLAGLLKEQGYRTVFFQSLSNAANGYWDGVLARNFGYEEFYPADSVNTEGYQVTNTFGFEEDIVLGPSEEWLSANGDRPFLAQYFTGTGHYGYDCVPNRYGYKYFSENEELDRYHNCLRMLDFFLQNLVDQYQRLGLYENTIFVLYGDHGEGFREHGRYMHGDNPYEEGLRVPLLIHAPAWFEDGERAKGLSSQLDILPTVLEMLGFEVENGEYPGYSLLHPLPADRTLMSSCVYPYRCMASMRGTEKYIHHFGDQPDEFFDLSRDPLEEHNLADERSKEELDERREELLEWRSRLDAEYEDVLINDTVYSDTVREE